jgi:hypothetical protein
MKRVILCLVAFLLSGPMMQAQLPTGTILGVAKDPSGAVVPGVTITAQNTDTGQSRASKTGGDGAYRLDALSIGNYSVTAEAAGFQREVQSGLTLAVGQEAVVNFALQVGQATQTVSVTTQAPLVNTTSSSISSLVTPQVISDLPLNGRNYNDLTLLQIGVTKSLNSNNNATIGYNGTAYSSNGAPQRSNTYMLDGALMMSLSGNNGSSALGTTLGVDGIQEYRIITNSFDAEYGMTMGSQMTIVSKSGTNQFHGDIFEFLRNSVLDARNFFDLPPALLDGHRNPEFRRNQFGGAFGGPIRKDKTFFFGVYEGLRAYLGVTEISTTLGTLANPNGCHGAAGQTITLAQCPQLGAASAKIAPQMANFLNLYPAPNLVGTSNGTASNYGLVFPQVTPENYGQIRIDNTFSAKDNMFGRYTIDEASLPYEGLFNSNSAIESSTNQFLTIAENHIFSPALLNSARFSFSREPLVFATEINNPLLLQPGYELVTTPGLGMGSLSPGGVTGVGNGILSPRKQIENIFTGSDDVDYNRGRHSLKFGVLFNHYQYNVQTHGYDRGVIGFSNVANFLVGQTSTFSLTLPGYDSVTKYLHFDTMGFYGQDSWRVTPRLTLNVGMRYEPTTSVNEIKGNASNIRNPSTATGFTVGNPVFRNPSLRNWSPRFGFAWDAYGNGKTALRGGFDLLYDLATWGQTYMNYAGYDPPFSENISSSTYGVMQVPIAIPALGTFLASYRGPVWAENQPHLMSYNLTVEQQLPDQMGLTLAYAGSHGINLIQVLEGNNVLPTGVPTANGSGLCVAAPAGSTPNLATQYDGSATSCYLTTSPRLNTNFPSMVFNPATGTSNYNALEINLNKRVTRGLQFQGAYTWSHLTDNQQGGSGQDGNDEAEEPLHTRSMRGAALFALANNFHLNAIYYLPSFTGSKGFVSKAVNGWWVSGILSVQSGYPFGVTYSGDREEISYTPSFANRDEPNLIPGRTNSNITHGVSTGCGTIAAGTKLHTTALWYDPCAFSIQPQGFIGTAPRNFLRGPGLTNLDNSLVKDTKAGFLGEAGEVEFRAEFFDIFNHPNFTLPGQTVSSGSCAAGTAAPLAACAMNPISGVGAISSTIQNSGALPGGQRQIQFGLKIMF